MSTLQYRHISNTDLQVSPICLGTMTFGTPVGEVDAIKLVHYAIDKGINFMTICANYFLSGSLFASIYFIRKSYRILSISLDSSLVRLPFVFP
ncbi:aldo/keto reductase [bacterium]|nr:aldo/keto reductase [bacterium]